MAVDHGTRKFLTYRALYRLNRAFAHVDRNLTQLDTAQIFQHDVPSTGQPRHWQDLLAEMQAEINRRLTRNLHAMEHGDLKHLAQVAEMSPKIREMLYGPDVVDEDAPAGSRRSKPTSKKSQRKKPGGKR